MTKIRFDYGTVTIRDGWLAAPTPELTAILNTLATTLPGYGSVPFILDEDFNIAEGLIRMVGAGKILHRDKMPSPRVVDSDLVLNEVARTRRRV